MMLGRYLARNAAARNQRCANIMPAAIQRTEGKHRGHMAMTGGALKQDKSGSSSMRRARRNLPCDDETQPVTLSSTPVIASAAIQSEMRRRAAERRHGSRIPSETAGMKRDSMYCMTVRLPTFTSPVTGMPGVTRKPAGRLRSFISSSEMRAR
jgi:hypothetical protein